MWPSISSTTPPMASTDRRDSCDSYDSEAYFSTTYVPLSNLPTPPLLSHSIRSSGEYVPTLAVDGDLDPSLLGPACYLKNLVPSRVSLVDPEIHVVHSILASAGLPLSTIALAVCILDSLNSRFALSWRRSFPLTHSENLMHQQLHIDSVRPEVIILSALIISVKFLDDLQSTTRLYSEDWGSGRWNCHQINATEQAIMENLGYRLLPLWTEALISDAVEEMERAGRYASGLAGHSMPQTLELVSKADLSGKAVWSTQRQITPAETPMPENVCGTVKVGPKTRRAFEVDHGIIDQTMSLPKRTLSETFPLYSEPLLGS